MTINNASDNNEIEFNSHETKEIEAYFPAYSGRLPQEAVILYINEIDLNRISDTLDFKINFI